MERYIKIISLIIISSDQLIKLFILSFLLQAFPDALFHHLLFAMAHPDHETRVGAHHVFATVLMPSLVYPWSLHGITHSQALSGPVLQNIKSETLSVQDASKDSTEFIGGVSTSEESEAFDHSLTKTRKGPSFGQPYSFKNALTDGKAVRWNLYVGVTSLVKG